MHILTAYHWIEVVIYLKELEEGMKELSGIAAT